MVLLLLITELLLLYLLSRRVIGTLYWLLRKISRSRPIAIWVVSIIFFPGTVVHELSHLFTAEILGVHTGKLTLTPEGMEGPHFAKASWGETEIKAGGVMIAETDPFRRTLIGLAPVSVGIIVLAALSYFLSSIIISPLQNNPPGNFLPNPLPPGENMSWGLWLIIVGLFYLIFIVSNSMFSSKEDMKGVLPFAVTVALFAAAGYFAGFRIGLAGELLTKTLLVIETLVRSLGIVLAVNLLVLAATSLLLSLFSPRKK